MSLTVLSLGAGVQSTTVLLLAIHGEIDRIDHAVFADTGWEPRAVYRHLEWLSERAAKAGIPVHRVSAGNIRRDALKAVPRGRRGTGDHWISLPYFTRDDHDHLGMARRQCTVEYKAAPIQRELRRLLGAGPRERLPAASVCQVFGFSVDEVSRLRSSKFSWITYRYPLVWERRMTRADCLHWLSSNGYPRPPRSACIGCPFKSDDEWRAVRSVPEEWADALAFDEAIREAGPAGGLDGRLYLHKSGRPLADVDLDTPEEKGQLALWNGECEGLCGV